MSAVQSVVNRFETCARVMEIWLLSSGDERPGHMVGIKAAVMLEGCVYLLMSPCSGTSGRVLGASCGGLIQHVRK